MADQQAQHGTEQATARRKAEARKKGQVALSREVPFAVSLLAVIGLLYGFMGPGLSSLVGMMREWLLFAVGEGARTTMSGLHLQTIAVTVGSQLGLLVMPIAGTLTLVGTGAYVAQTGFLWKEDALKLDGSKLNPVSGLQRLLSFRSVAETIKALLKIGLIGYAGWAAVRNDVAALPALAGLELGSILAVSGGIAFKMSIWISLAVAAIAALDYAYQRFEWERNLRMTKQEIKQEHRETEGDPLLRSRIRSLQRERARNRMIAAVPKADVVITNPDHLAVALRYDQQTMGAPVVIAKGAGYIAQRIKEVAREHGIMVIENKPVARSLYRLVEVGREIPGDLYRAVAEILALVYRAKGKTVGK
jgi:flagellar biosynthetic protein FlhB